MVTRKRFVGVFSLLLVGFVLLYTTALLPEIRMQSLMNTLKQDVIQKMSGLPFVPQQTCPLMPINDSQAEAAYDKARADALANLLTASQAQNLSVSDLLDLFSTGVEAATGTQDGAYLIDEHNGFIVVSMKLPLCQRRHKYSYKPELYVFSRAGSYWLLSVGVIQHIEWMKDRWVGMMQLQIEEGRELYAFIHIVQQADDWRMLTFFQTLNGPGLMYFGSPVAVNYSQGYDHISYSSGGVYGPLPCDFSGGFPGLRRDNSCHDCPLAANYAIYHGTFNFVWTGDNYRLTDDGSYQITIILCDSTRLEEIPPNETELAQKSLFLRPGSWRDYCKRE